MSLTTYNKKRDFKQTSEPSGKENNQQEDEKLVFVIQRHKASRLHYDFRLEMDGGAEKLGSAKRSRVLNPTG
ncbi:MAG: hypothetical protein WKG06_34555 [Segetibacter sp.]